MPMRGLADGLREMSVINEGFKFQRGLINQREPHLIMYCWSIL